MHLVCTDCGPSGPKIAKGPALHLHVLIQRGAWSLKSLKEKLISPAVFALQWLQGKYTFDTHAIEWKIGYKFLQKQPDGHNKAIGYLSRSLTHAERAYDIFHLECLAVVCAKQLSLPYHECTQFTIWADHDAVKWILDLVNATGKLPNGGCCCSKWNSKSLIAPELSIRQSAHCCEKLQLAKSAIQSTVRYQSCQSTPHRKMKVMDAWNARTSSTAARTLAVAPHPQGKRTQMPNYNAKGRYNHTSTNKSSNQTGQWRLLPKRGRHSGDTQVVLLISRRHDILPSTALLDYTV